SEWVAMEAMKLLMYFLFIANCDGYVRLTNLKCETFDKTFIQFPTCRLNVLGRNNIALNVYVKLIKLPIKRMIMRFIVYRKLNGYHPFLFNVSEEICHFMKHPNPLKVFYYFQRAVMPDSNLNHTCPYNVSSFKEIQLYFHDVIVRNFTARDGMFAKVPLPQGSYMFTLELDDGASSWIAMVSIYLDIDVDSKI
ncbi:hypothetical protein KR018_005794, partial [Drosophila ironensis]